MSESRTIRVGALTRVEGEGALHVSLNNNVIDRVELNIYESPRFFEAFLRGRPLEDVPDLTARICGICPVAYQMSSACAIEAALEIEIPTEIHQLRKLLYCGEWIESHCLHMHLLQAPDFFGYSSGLELGKHFPDEIKRGLRLKKIGNQILEVLGGRSVHPVNVCIGGFYRTPALDELQSLIPELEWGLQAAIETTHWISGFNFPDFVCNYDLISISNSSEYPWFGDTMGSSKGESFDVKEYEQVICEYQVPHSTALQAHKIESQTSCLFGPLARINHSRDNFHPNARELADRVNIQWPCNNPFQSILARGLEVVHAFEEALEICRNYQRPSESRIPYQPRAAVGMAATEAPRGTLFHRYEIDDAGLIQHATIIPPTSQNQKQIENDLRDYLPPLLSMEDDQVAQACERLIRSYDPCISCATHFLKLSIERVE
ncbi:Ni/Fe hydrogenase subunit alpha [Rubinisphaera italica]|uniref:NAD-reducing hydrogenase HoxS subunit beta n=1 Tax=Rubinisphaera italica TaxID=2527969 RepID=A0A5C5XBL2_9PLAN|nr:Ni/Fe hydrogenase subunit alpha [Rubinisphaera italica]TWT59673.1 NAD-reducing hydrogenase HoxS subunit beta [Rubinisphaera italica]